ncbi:hypothetical protein CAEBREN_21124 [Caenorhabditis brenneri]|uniref:Uncharacterized protein n=1 Tax=Caenorhabditis brenneri TaxID=135651 RepID=G0M8H2_CAEBE|nr:hypothetical protein CAEBREN_21124 [Caenorhabditis brenneri]
MTPLSEQSLREVSTLIEQNKIKNVQLFDEFAQNEKSEAKDFSLAFSQNLKKLDMQCVFKNKYLLRKYGEMSENEARPFAMNIVGVLKHLLNPESRKGLLQLRFIGYKLQFPDGWVREVGTMLPSLECLDIDHCPLNARDFMDLCNSFAKLKKLSVYGTGLTNIEGISELKNLELFNISDVKFESKDDIKELASLTKLRVLNISGQHENDLNTLQLYLANDCVLNELRFIDISFNTFTPEELQKLVETHPKLMMISLIGTDVGKSNEKLPINIANQFLKFTTVRSFRDCLDAFKFYADTYSVRTIDTIFETINYILSENYEQQSPSELIECTALMFDKFEIRVMTKNLRLLAVRCFEQLGRGKRFEMWDARQKEAATNFMLLCVEEDYRDLTNPDELDPDLYETHCIAWKFLLHLLYTVPTQPFVDLVTDHAIHTILSSPEWTDIPVQISIFILSVCLDQLSPSFVTYATRHHLLLQQVNRYIMNTFSMPNTTFLIQIVWTIVDLHKKSNEKDDYVSREIIETLMRCIEYARDFHNDFVQKHCFKALEELALDCPEEFLDQTFHSYSSSIFLPVIRPQSMRQNLRLQAISLSIVLYARTEGKERMEHLIETKDDLANEICVVIGKNRSALLAARDPYDFWQVLSDSNKTSDAMHWGIWVSKYCKHDRNSPLIPMQIIESERFFY